MLTPSKQLLANGLTAVFLYLISMMIAAPVALSQMTEFPQNDPRYQLQQMAKALNSLSYQGTLTYEFGGPLETLLFEHRIDGDGRHESIRHLSGRPRAFNRHQPAGDCGNAASRLFSGSSGAPLAAIEAHYDFQLLGQNRIADRIVNVVQIKPKSDDRYGFTVGIDRETHLPLMLTINGLRGKILERFQFVEVSLGPSATGHYSLDEAKRLALADQRCAPAEVTASWRPEWVPPGFVLASASHNSLASKAGELDSNDMGVATLNFTDGLSSLSVVVAPIATMSPAVGVVQRGATVAAMTMAAHNQDSYKVSVIGEVPPQVARRVAASVKYSSPK